MMVAKESEETIPPQLNNYRIVRSKENLLGKGGYGRVYKAKYIPTGEYVAVKEIEKMTKPAPF